MTTMLARPAVAAVLAIVALAGCGTSPPARIYALTTMAAPAPVTTRPLSLAVGPIDLPAYLDRAELVRRVSGTRLAASEMDRWAEPLDPLFARTLREDLSLILGSQAIHPMPNDRQIRFDHQVEVEVLRFEPDEHGVVLDARWRLYGADGDTLRRTERTMVAKELAANASGEEIVAAMSAAVADLATAIAAALVPEPLPTRRPATPPAPRSPATPAARS